MAFLAPTLSHNLYSVFAEDEFQIWAEKLALTIGSKFEHNRFTGWEIQPNVRLTYTPTRKQTLWAAVGRGARTPSGVETSMQAVAEVFPLPNGLLGVVQSDPNPNLGSEHLLSWEFGYRVQIGRKLSFDLATFYNSYSHLDSQEPQAPFLAGPPMHLVLPVKEGNNLFGRSWGSEFSATWKPWERWKLVANYSYLGIDIDKKLSSGDTTFRRIAGSSPRHQAFLRSSLDLTRFLDWDLSSRFVDRLVAVPCPGYFEMDSKLTWKMGTNWKFSLVGENLAHPHHLEFGQESLSLTPTAVKRSLYGKVEWHF